MNAVAPPLRKKSRSHTLNSCKRELYAYLFATNFFLFLFDIRYGSRPDPLNPPIRGQKLERPLRKQSGGLFLSRRVDELIATNTPQQARQVFSDKTQHTSVVPRLYRTVDTLSTVRSFPFLCGFLHCRYILPNYI